MATELVKGEHSLDERKEVIAEIHSSIDDITLEALDRMVPNLGAKIKALDFGWRTFLF